VRLVRGALRRSKSSPPRDLRLLSICLDGVAPSALLSNTRLTPAGKILIMLSKNYLLRKKIHGLSRLMSSVCLLLTTLLASNSHNLKRMLFLKHIVCEMAHVLHI